MGPRTIVSNHNQRPLARGLIVRQQGFQLVAHLGLIAARRIITVNVSGERFIRRLQHPRPFEFVR
jgi:hypothetical protein